MGSTFYMRGTFCMRSTFCMGSTCYMRSTFCKERPYWHDCYNSLLYSQYEFYQDYPEANTEENNYSNQNCLIFNFVFCRNRTELSFGDRLPVTVVQLPFRMILVHLHGA
uniref:Uncharacterized protein n=1 Tax=Cacopsylla melanoneura TaxID=428564 RepID=A0A8D8RGC0_9HEMI